MKLSGRLFSLALAALTAIGASAPAAASGLTSDPFIRQNTARQNFEPGGKYHLFGSRGAVADRTGSISIIPVYRHRLGHLEAEYARIQGKIGYKTRFSNHPHTEHSPFTNSSSRSASDSKGNIGINLTNYNIQWSGTEVHPANAYDGQQGGGYPAPTGARDEYSYTVSGTAAAMNIRLDDYRGPWERFADRLTPVKNLPAATKQAWDTATTTNPNLNRAGNAANAVNAAAAGIGNVAGAAANAIGAGDATQGLGVLAAAAGMEAVRALPPAAQIQAVKGIAQTAGAANHAGNAVRNWARNNPNTAETVKAASNIGGATLGAVKGIGYARSRYEFGDIGGNTVKNKQRGVITTINKKIDAVINETNTQKGNITSKYTLSGNEALDVGTKFLGKGYTEIGKRGSGVYRSADGTRQFRIDNSSLTGGHNPNVPHIHLERINPGKTKPITNNHIPIKD